jgi:hypothetical protein
MGGSRWTGVEEQSGRTVEGAAEREKVAAVTIFQEKLRDPFSGPGLAQFAEVIQVTCMSQAYVPRL